MSRSSALMTCGRLTEALADAELCEQFGRRLNSDRATGGGLAYRAGVALYRGELTAANELFGEAQLHLDRSSHRMGKTINGAFWALAALRGGLPDLATEQLDIARGRMSAGLAPAASYLDGYASAVEVALHLYRHAASTRARNLASSRLGRALYYLIHFAH